jgi:hypothetical protein
MISSIPNSGIGYVSVGLDKLKTYLIVSNEILFGSRIRGRKIFLGGNAMHNCF